ncbi:MAG: ABC transporter substrate-binding protein [Armatimonadota bacterium]|nr:ABC transporter substrate-binding protein [Armatimonadota bacterium]
MTTITVAHSPDSDDAFMHYALARHKIDTGGIEFRHVLQDIETLNKRAGEGIYEVTAISIHAYAYLADRYVLLNHGASMGEGYGPMIVAREPFSTEAIKAQVVAVPGTMTSAYLALKLFAPQIQTTVLPFDHILPAVAEGRVAAGLLIHEGQLTYLDAGLHNILDLGVWWADATGGLPLPLGGNAIRRDLGPELMQRVSHLLRESIRYALEHRDEALDYALEFARDMETRRHLADRFVGMYVNQRTLDYGDDGRRAVQLFLDKGFEQGIIPHKANVEFVG